MGWDGVARGLGVWMYALISLFLFYLTMGLICFLVRTSPDTVAGYLLPTHYKFDTSSNIDTYSTIRTYLSRAQATQEHH